MKVLFYAVLFLILSDLMTAQVNTNSVAVPNTGANTTIPPAITYTSPADNMSNPTNSTVPGANGSYTIDPAKPDITNPGAGGSYTVLPNTTPSNSPSTTFSPQTQPQRSSEQKKRSGK